MKLQKDKYGNKIKIKLDGIYQAVRKFLQLLLNYIKNQIIIIIERISANYIWFNQSIEHSKKRIQELNSTKDDIENGIPRIKRRLQSNYTANINHPMRNNVTGRNFYCYSNIRRRYNSAYSLKKELRC
jgi:hypothetical protein